MTPKTPNDSNPDGSRSVTRYRQRLFLMAPGLAVVLVMTVTACGSTRPDTSPAGTVDSSAPSVSSAVESSATGPTVTATPTTAGPPTGTEATRKPASPAGATPRRSVPAKPKPPARACRLVTLKEAATVSPEKISIGEDRRDVDQSYCSFTTVNGSLKISWVRPNVKVESDSGGRTHREFYQVLARLQGTRSVPGVPRKVMIWTQGHATRAEVDLGDVLLNVEVVSDDSEAKAKRLLALAVGRLHG